MLGSIPAARGDPLVDAATKVGHPRCAGRQPEEREDGGSIPAAQGDPIEHVESAADVEHRLVRIYPTFLIVLAICATFAIAAGGPLPFDPIGASLVPAGERFYALRVEWTLLFEVAFYVVLFAVSLAGWTRWLERGASAWLVLLLACSVVFPGWNHEATPPVYRLPLLPACTGFAAGLLIPAALRLGWISRWTFAGRAVARACLGRPADWRQPVRQRDLGCADGSRNRA
jgi:hypothetical protein